MTVEEIRRGDAWWKITYGYGRIQRVRAIYRNRLPEKARRALVMNPDASLEELFKEIGPEEYSTYGDAVAKDVIAAVLQSAHDWNGIDAETYIEDSLPEDVGLEIVAKMRSVLASGQTVSDEIKKN